jgi:hypothetical protein
MNGYISTIFFLAWQWSLATGDIEDALIPQCPHHAPVINRNV